MKAKRDRFPITIKRGSCSVKIYRDRKPTGTYYRVCYHIGGKRERLNFKELDKQAVERQRQAQAAEESHTWVASQVEHINKTYRVNRRNETLT